MMGQPFSKMKFVVTKYTKQTIISVFTDYFVFKFSNFGASIIGLTYKNVEMVLSPRNIDDVFEKDYFYGKTIGAIANRVENGKVIIDNKTFQMRLNEGNNSHHGGPNGISNKLFDYFVDEEEGKIVFIYKKKDLEDGLPGNIEYKITYKISNKLRVEFEAISDKNTIVSLTNHTFFCLKEKNVNAFTLKANCDRYVETNPDNLLPLKASNIPNFLDFRNGLALKTFIDIPLFQSSKAKGYDHDLIFTKEGCNQIFLEDSKSQLIIETDFPSFQIYSDNYENKYKFIDVKLNKRSSLAIEPCDILTDRKILKANELYRRFIEYTIKEK